jgi:hypothetical protein
LEANAELDWDRVTQPYSLLRRQLRLGAFHKFEAIAERVEDVDATKAVKGSVGLGGEAGALAGAKDGVEPFNYECGMGTLGGMKVRLDAEMQIYGTGDEPDAFAFGHLRRLGNFSESEDAGVEGASAVFTGDGDGDLHVVETEDWHGWRLRGLFCTTRLNFTDRATQALAGSAHFVLQLQIHPKLLGHSEEPSQSDGRIGGDTSPLQDNVVDTGSGDVKTSSKLVSGEVHRLEEFFTKNLTRMNLPIGCRICSLSHRISLAIRN